MIRLWSINSERLHGLEDVLFGCSEFCEYGTWITEYSKEFRIPWPDRRYATIFGWRIQVFWFFQSSSVVRHPAKGCTVTTREFQIARGCAFIGDKVCRRVRLQLCRCLTRLIFLFGVWRYEWRHRCFGCRMCFQQRKAS